MARTKTRLVFKSEGFRDILLSDGTADAIRSVGESAQSRMSVPTSLRVVRGYSGGRNIAILGTSCKTQEDAYKGRRELLGAL